MKVSASVASVVAVAGLACSAMGQDSVSNKYVGVPVSGMPGDGLSPWTTGSPNQIAHYAVDMTNLYTSCGTRLGIAPLMKTTKSDSAHFGSLTSGQALSQTLLSGVAATVAASYDEWQTFPGGGIHPTMNYAGSPWSPQAWTPQLFNQFAATVAEFSTDDGGKSVNNLLTAVVNYAPERPRRLWVTRVVSAVNETASGAGDNSQFGTGAVDASGHLYFRADTGATGANKLLGNNVFRVRNIGTGGRSASSINEISQSGGSDAGTTDRIVNASGVVHTTPTCVPSELSSLAIPGSYLGVRFGPNSSTGGDFLWENASMNVNATAAHRAGGPAAAVDNRGGVTFSQANLFGGVGTAAAVTKSTMPNGDPADRVSVWAVNANGSVGTAHTFVLPTNLTESCGAYALTNDGWDNYHSQVAFRGGNGQIAITKDQYGNGLIAGMVTQNRGSATWPWNAIAVGRFDPTQASPTVTWTMAAWNDIGANGQPIKGDYGLDGVPFTGDPGEFDHVCDALDAPIGRTALMSELGISVLGPSMSSPVFDSVGNIYFMSAVALNKDGFTDFDSALLRANYNPVTNCYELELVMELGDTFYGINSGTQYQVQFMEIADSNSISSGTMYSGNGAQYAWNNMDPQLFFDDEFNLTTADPRALGGLVVAAKIVYDVDADTDFDDPTRSGGDVNSPDEAYNALLYIGNIQKLCPADWDGNGFANADDLDYFLNAYFYGDPAYDYNEDGFATADDFDAFYLDFFNGTC